MMPYSFMSIQQCSGPAVPYRNVPDAYPPAGVLRKRLGSHQTLQVTGKRGIDLGGGVPAAEDLNAVRSNLGATTLGRRQIEEPCQEALRITRQILRTAVFGLQELFTLTTQARENREAGRQVLKNLVRHALRGAFPVSRYADPRQLHHRRNPDSIEPARKHNVVEAAGEVLPSLPLLSIATQDKLKLRGSGPLQLPRGVNDRLQVPTRIEAAGNKPKLIDEFIGRVNSATTQTSIAHMRSPSGWEEPGQTPELRS